MAQWVKVFDPKPKSDLQDPHFGRREAIRKLSSTRRCIPTYKIDVTKFIFS